MMAVVLVMSFTASAQPQGWTPQGPGNGPVRPRLEQRDPAQIAQEQTEQLDKLVVLSPKQYKKIYKFNKRQAKERQNEMEDRMPGRPDGFPPEGMRPGMVPGGMPPRGEGRFRPLDDGMKEMIEQQQAERVKKYRKVLTPEQFQKWESFEAQREFRQIIETPER